MRISRPPASSSPDVEMHAVNSHEDPVQDRACTDVRSASHPPQRYNNWVPDPRDIISVTSSSDSPPARRSARMSKKRATQFMAHVLVPPLPPGARRSDYSSVKERPRTRDPWAPGMGKTRAGDNSGSNKLMHVLQNAFESNWYGPGSTNTSRGRRRGRSGQRISL
jgi:hypothetical protein